MNFIVVCSCYIHSVARFSFGDATRAVMRSINEIGYASLRLVDMNGNCESTSSWRNFAVNVASLYSGHGYMLVSKVISAYRGSVAVSSRDTQPFREAVYLHLDARPCTSARHD